jgi:hypothetical protein
MTHTTLIPTDRLNQLEAKADEYDDLRSIFKKCVDIIAFDDREADIKIERIREVMLTAKHLQLTKGE